MIANDMKKVGEVTGIAEQRPTGGAGAWWLASRQDSKTLPLLPPQADKHVGKLTVLVNLIGTMVRSIPGEYAQRVPHGMRGYVTGKGEKFHPQGIFTVERPCLKECLQRLHAIAEVVVCTALLPVQADPILDKIEEGCGLKFAHRLYRDSATVCNGCRCIDVLRLGRDPTATVVVDDYPGQFYLQPDNGIPVKPFWYDPDDYLLAEVIAPALELLVLEPDVRPVLRKRYHMALWFKERGFPPAEQDAILSTGTVDADSATSELQGESEIEAAKAASTDPSDDEQGWEQLPRFRSTISVLPRGKPKAANSKTQENAGDLAGNKKGMWSRWMGRIANRCAAIVACR